MAKFPPDDQMELGNATKGAHMDDNELRQIKRRTSPIGRIALILVLGGAGALGYAYYRQDQAYEARWTIWNQAQDAKSRDEFLTSIRNDLGVTTFEEVKISYIRKIAQYHDAASVPALVAELDKENNNVRGEAAIALAAIGSPAGDAAKGKLLEVLPKTDIAHRAQVVWALAVLHEARAANEIIAEFSAGHLQDQPGFDPKVIADALGPTRLASPELTDAAKASIAVRTLVASALSETASTDAVEPLIRILKTAKPGVEAELIRTAATGLGRIGDARAGEPLFELLANDPSMRQSILDAMKKSIGAKGLARLLPMAKTDDLKLSLIKMLRETHDPAAADALATELASQNTDTRLEAALGLAEINDARGTDILVLAASGDDNNKAISAIDALRELHSPKAAQLTRILGDHPERRAAVLKALGTSGSPEAGPVLTKELSGDDIEVALNALGDLRYEPAYKKILELAKRPKNMEFAVITGANEVPYRNRRKAIEALGRYGKADSAATLMTIVEDAKDDLRLREAAGESLGLVADEAMLHTILAKVKNDAVEPITRRCLVQAFWHKPNRAIAKELIALLDAKQPEEIRRAAAIAIGYAADPENDAKLIELLGAPDKRRDAAFAVLLGGSDDAAMNLVGVLETDRDLREVIEFAVANSESDELQLLTPALFENGEVFRRIRVAQALRDGKGDVHVGLPLLNFASRLRSGWPGAQGVTAAFVREKLYAALTGSDAGLRVAAANILGDMNERGLLIRARDSEGQGAQDARAKLRELNLGPTAH